MVKWIILSHRYLGILAGGLFLLWFASGIGMMYAGGMPELSADARLSRLEEISLSRVQLSPQEAVQRAGLPTAVSGVSLLNVAGRPAYRLRGRGSRTVFADDGTLLRELNRTQALAVAERFAAVPAAQVRYDRLVTEPDQWTLTIRGGLPFHKIAVLDDRHTELYVSLSTGEVEMLTTRGTRALAWVAAIPHWLYFTPLRTQQGLWTRTILFTAAAGCVLAVLGLVVGLLQFRFSLRFRPGRIRSYIPYTGWMRWHHITGLVFGIFTLTWVFSGFLSMEPFGWASGGGLSGAPIQRALTGGDLDLGGFPDIDTTSWDRLTRDHAIKEIAYARIQGRPFFVLNATSREAPLEVSRLLLDARTLRIRDEPFPADSLATLVRESYPDVPMLESSLLTEYDSYYYDRDRRAPLPVLRLKFGDPERTWFYIDPAVARLSGSIDRRDRLERWIYKGFHSLDFGFWYYNRPLWDIGVIVLSLGGLSSSAIGLYLGLRRLTRGLQRGLAR